MRLGLQLRVQQHDFLAIAEAESDTQMAAVLLAAGSGGGVTDLRTTVAMTSTDATGAFAAARMAPGPPAMITPAPTAHAAQPIIEPQPPPTSSRIDAADTEERVSFAASSRGDDATGNPSTEVYLLTDSIDEDGARRRTRPTTARDQSRDKAEAAAEKAKLQAELDELAGRSGCHRFITPRRWTAIAPGSRARSSSSPRRDRQDSRSLTLCRLWAGLYRISGSP